MKTLKNFVITGLIICLVFLSNSVLFAEPISRHVTSNICSNSETVVENRKIVSLIDEISISLNKKRYEKFISFTSGDLNLSFSDLFFGADSRENMKKNIGLWNLKSFKIIKYKQVPNDQVPSSSVSYNDYLSYTNLVTYYVCCDISAKEDNSDMFSGTNYFIFVFGKDNNSDYKLLQWSQPVIKEMQLSNLAFNDGTENLQNKIQEAGLFGVVLNGKGERIEKYSASAQTANNPYYCLMPSKIRVKIKSTGRITTVDFYSYVKNVLPNEWTAFSDPMESLKAGAMAVKMYGWYRCYNHKYYGMGFDVYDTIVDQVYRAGSEHKRSTQAINAVSGIGIKNTEGLIFETQYNARAQAQHSGYISQTGANSLANKGYTWLQICDYYYSNSSKSTGNISTFNYYIFYWSKHKLDLIFRALLGSRITWALSLGQ